MVIFVCQVETTMRINFHIVEALRGLVTQPCNRSNCGTVCLCASCHARRALPAMERRELRYRKRQLQAILQNIEEQNHD